MAKKCNKYSYVNVVQGFYGYGHGWEDLTESVKYSEARADLKSYRDNERGTPHRMIGRRVLNKSCKNGGK